MGVLEEEFTNFVKVKLNEISSELDLVNNESEFIEILVDGGYLSSSVKKSLMKSWNKHNDVTKTRIVEKNSTFIKMAMG